MNTLSNRQSKNTAATLPHSLQYTAYSKTHWKKGKEACGTHSSSNKFASIYSFCLFALIKRNHIFTQKLTWERNNQPDINILFKKMCNPLPQYAPISYYIWIKWTSSSNMKMTLQKSHNLICSYSFKKKKYLWKPYTPVQRNKASKQVIIITGSVTGEVMIMMSF